MPRVVTASRSESELRVSSARFRPAQRLHSPAEFAAVFARRRVLRGTWFDLLVSMPNDSRMLGNARLGLVVPKRLMRLSARRNAIKRQAREAFRHVAMRLPSFDLVLRLSRKPTVGSADFKSGIRREIDVLISRVTVEVS